MGRWVDGWVEVAGLTLKHAECVTYNDDQLSGSEDFNAEVGRRLLTLR